ncbi:MAG: haloacid dehalogenase-like hydrolase [Verrucomicrobiota bacterium]
MSEAILTPFTLSGETAAVEAEIVAAAAALRAACPDAVGVAFWDFDGTVFDGDCTEGFGVLADGSRMAGMVEESLRLGLAAAYADPGGFTRCWRRYLDLMRDEGIPEAYAYIVKIFEGARAGEILDLSRKRFHGPLREWFFPEAIALWNRLEADGIRCVVISASADFFVKGAAGILRAPEERLHGVRLAENADGTLSGDVVPPLTCAEGKAERMRGILEEMALAAPGRTFWPVAAFGNHTVTDGPLLEAVAATLLPAGRPLGVLVNSTAPRGNGILRRLTFPRRSSP